MNCALSTGFNFFGTIPAWKSLLSFGCYFLTNMGRKFLPVFISHLPTFQGAIHLTHSIPLDRTSSHPWAWIGEMKRKKQCPDLGFLTAHTTWYLCDSPCFHCNVATFFIPALKSESWAGDFQIQYNTQKSRLKFWAACHSTQPTNSKASQEGWRRRKRHSWYKPTIARWRLSKMRCLPAAESLICP